MSAAMTRSRALAVAAAALVGLGALPGTAAAAGAGTIEDDYPAALAAAKARGVPILVDVWAPW